MPISDDIRKATDRAKKTQQAIREAAQQVETETRSDQPSPPVAGGASTQR